jgi:predicted metal-dependent phosphotriesterase family hydrolase
MKRRAFIKSSGALLIGMSAQPSFAQKGIIMTVNGAISPDKMGFTLTHEHALVDFTGAGVENPDRANPEDTFKLILPHLKRLKGLGCQTLVECTPAYIGRDPILLRRFSQATGLHILTNTGYYAAGNAKFIPQSAYQETSSQIAARWIKEWNDGIDGTGIRPGFIKIGIDAGPLKPIARKIGEAAAKTSKATGLTIAAHKGDSISGMAMLELIIQQGANPKSFILVHSQGDWKLESRIKAAAMGAWISIDAIRPDNIAANLQKVLSMKQAGFLNRVLISHDAYWVKGKINGSYDTIITTFIPALKNSGFSQSDINQLLIKNSCDAFTIGN